MKIALARLLLSEPDMLLLDEPTNHLDAKAKAWLGRYISSYDGTVKIEGRAGCRGMKQKSREGGVV